jgi:hypothetical protein
MDAEPVRVVVGDELGYVKTAAAPCMRDIATAAVVARWGGSAHRRLGVEALAAALDPRQLPSTSAASSPVLAGAPHTCRLHCRAQYHMRSLGVQPHGMAVALSACL